MNKGQAIPRGWRLASVNDVVKYHVLARKAIDGEWAICMLVDGKICGPGYGFEVQKGFFDCGDKLITNICAGKHPVSKKQTKYLDC